MYINNPIRKYFLNFKVYNCKNKNVYRKYILSNTNTNINTLNIKGYPSVQND